MGLRSNDLRDLANDIFEIDSFKSKMGSDEEIVVLSFSVNGQEPAKDLMNFFEKGYDFILDSDVTSSEQSDGTYKVFVEMERNSQVPSQILEIVDGFTKLANIENPRFRYYKSFTSYDVNEESLDSIIPQDKDAYLTKKEESMMENYKNFFNRSYVEDINVLGNTLHISKKYADPLAFEIVDFGDTTPTLKSIKESINVNDFAEIIFLSKYIGDYNITKFGDLLTFENADKTLVVRRK